MDIKNQINLFLCILVLKYLVNIKGICLHFFRISGIGEILVKELK